VKALEEKNQRPMAEMQPVDENAADVQQEE
jgi:hypothetical protein